MMGEKKIKAQAVKQYIMTNFSKADQDIAMVGGAEMEQLLQ